MAEKQNITSEASVVRKTRKSRQGLVVSNKMDKTVVVAITSQVRHPQYGKFVRRTKKYVAHDETNQCGVGDTVRIVETRPLSRTKRWRVQSIVSKAV
jgi:small subunit ribosomal protein S17